MDPVVALIVRGALALLFGAAAAHKLADPAGFRATLAAYRLLPARAVGAASVGVVGVEVALAGALLVPGAQAAALAGAAALLVAYGGAIAANLVRGRRDLDCGCLATGGRRPVSWWLVARNGALAAGAAAVAAGPPAPRPLAWIDAVTVLGALAATALAWTAADGLLANRGGVARLRGAA